MSWRGHAELTTGSRGSTLRALCIHGTVGGEIVCKPVTAQDLMTALYAAYEPKVCAAALSRAHRL